MKRYLHEKYFGLFFLLLAAIFLYTFDLGELPLRDWDEGIVAIIAREIYRADAHELLWLYPQNLSGSPYWNKPPLVHNLIALSYYCFGISDWSTRLVPALFGAFCVPLLFLIGREIFPSRQEAYFSALVYLTLIPVARHNRLAMLDGAVTFWFCLGLLCLLKLKPQKVLLADFSSRYHQLFFSFLLGFSFAGICLSKGVAIALLLGLILVVYVLVEGSYFAVLRSPKNLICFLIGFSIVPIWYGLQYLQYGVAFLSYNLGTQAFGRITNAVENNSQPWWFYYMELLKYGLPWLVFLPGGLLLAIRQYRQSWSKLAVIWFGIYLVTVSMMNTKLPWYIIPLYPGFSLLIGAKLSQLVQHRSRLGSAYQVVFAVLAGILGLAFVYLLWGYQPQDIYLVLIAGCLVLTMILTAVLLQFNSAYSAYCLVGFLYLTLLIFFNSHHSIWELAEAYPVKPVAQLINQAIPNSNQIVYSSYPYYRPSLDFYSDHRIVPISEINLNTILTTPASAYFLTARDYPVIANTRVIVADSDWQIRIKD